VTFNPRPVLPGGNHWHRVPRELSVRAKALTQTLGVVRARDLLGVSPCTFDELRSGGRLRPAVLLRIEQRLTELGA